MQDIAGKVTQLFPTVITYKPLTM